MAYGDPHTYKHIWLFHLSGNGLAPLLNQRLQCAANAVVTMATLSLNHIIQTMLMKFL